MFETDEFYFVGNNLGIDLINTKIAVDGRPKDLLVGLEDLISWTAAAGLIPLAEADARLADWTKFEKPIIFDVIGLRTRIHDLMVDLCNGQPVKNEHLAAINKLLRSKSGYSEIVRANGGFEKVLIADLTDPRQLLAAIAESVADLLAYGDLSLIRKCENPECVLYFYDTTKNHKRRWCSMSVCGNRAKAKAFYERKKSVKA